MVPDSLTVFTTYYKMAVPMFRAPSRDGAAVFSLDSRSFGLTRTIMEPSPATIGISSLRVYHPSSSLTEPKVSATFGCYVATL